MKRSLLYVAMFLLLALYQNSYAEEKGYFSKLYDDLTKDSGFSFAKKRKIREWWGENKYNKRGRESYDNDLLEYLHKKGEVELSLKIDEARLGCAKRKKQKRYPSDSGYSYECQFSSKMANNAKVEMSGLIINIKVYNKSKNSLVVEDIVALPISVYPTIEKKIAVQFQHKALTEAISQLDGNYSWNYELVAFLPSDLFVDPNNTFSKYVSYDWLAE